jgi:hypothetical protein
MLLPGEQELWRRMSGPDRRHAVGVGRDASRLLGAQAPPRQFVAAALLHDVGKVEARLGTFSRVAVTLAALVVGRRRLIEVTREAPPRSLKGRARLYLEHDKVGGSLLRRAGSEPFTVEWAEQHHTPAERWTVESRMGQALKAADGD